MTFASPVHNLEILDLLNPVDEAHVLNAVADVMEYSMQLWRPEKHGKSVRLVRTQSRVSQSDWRSGPCAAGTPIERAVTGLGTNLTHAKRGSNLFTGTGSKGVWVIKELTVLVTASGALGHTNPLSHCPCSPSVRLLALMPKEPRTPRPFLNGKRPTLELVVQPDRGNNGINCACGQGRTIDYQGRQLLIDFTSTPCYGKTAVVRCCPTDTLALLFGHYCITNVVAWRPLAPMHKAGLRRSWVSDEYGPYIYHFGEFGDLIQIPDYPAAIVPLDSAGQLTFVSDSDPVTAQIKVAFPTCSSDDDSRRRLLGLEGLTIFSDGNTLYALLQSATARRWKWEEHQPLHTTARLRHLARNGRRSLSSRLCLCHLTLPAKRFLRTNCTTLKTGCSSLARNNNGHGGAVTLSEYNPGHTIAPGGVLSSCVVLATYVSFVNRVDSEQLARFGLHDVWESLAIAPVFADPAAPDDSFLFTTIEIPFPMLSIGVHSLVLQWCFDEGKNIKAPKTSKHDPTIPTMT
ncbi:hypothetical protein EDB89DRAFT_2239928 [Lactarius sanguifluus]|nr:hypothetical protein EDB89DRAFT_2239928 [Lactarius sanguifluus]